MSMYDPDTGRRVEKPPAPPAKPVRKLPEAKEPTKEDRVDSLLAAYAWGLEHNSPRTAAELTEIRFLLGKELKPTPLTADEKKAMVAAAEGKVAKDSFLMEKGDPVPVNTMLYRVPTAVVTAHPDLAGCSYAVVDDKILLVDLDRKVTALV